MARLIDADDLIERIEDVLSRREHRQAEVPSWLQKIIDELTIAYDVERVVGELEELEDTDTREIYLRHHIDCDDAIYIVRKGGVNENNN